MMRDHSRARTVLAFALGLSMLMPGIAVVGTAYLNATATGGMPELVGEDLALVDGILYKAWVEGPTHETSLMLSSSEDGGATWDQPASITPRGFNPMDVKLEGAKGMLHVIWTDGTSRDLATGHMMLNTASGQWSRPVLLEGQNADIAASGDMVAVSASVRGMLGVHVSQDGGLNFDTMLLEGGPTCQRTAIRMDGAGLGIAFSGGFRDAASGALSGRGIYLVEADTQGLGMPERVTTTDWPVRDISLDDGALTWTVDTGKSLDTYQADLLDSGLAEPKLVSSEPAAAPPVQGGLAAATRLPPKKWTYIGYVDADNNLDSFGYEDVNEMEMIGSTADVNMVVLFDGQNNGDSKCWYIQQDADTSTVTSPEIALSDINPGWGTELNMGDPQTAIDFIEYVYANYPAERYLMDFWNHGGSWLYGMCSDDTDADDFTMQEVRSIYETVRADTWKNKLFDVIGYDECLMSDVSVDYDEMPYVDYICNSEDSIAGDGWEYNLVLEPITLNPDMMGEECAFTVFQAYVDMYGTSGALTTMSIINTTMFYHELVPAINNFAQKAMHEISAYRSDLQTCASNAMDWQGYTHQKDLLDFCQNVVSTLPASDTRTAAQEIINVGTANPPGTQYGDPAWQHDLSIMIHNQNTGENGITIYLADPPYDTLYDTMTFTDTNWDEFYKVLWGTDPDQPNTEPAVVITSPADGGYVTTGSVVTITGTASDTDGTVQGVDVAIDNEHWAPATGTNSWSFNWDTTGWDIGWHYIMARSYDGQDYSDPYIIEVRIIVDPNLPDLTLWPSDIGFSDPTPNEGDVVTIDATVYNVGTVNASENTEIGFYDGNPAAGGTLIGIVPASPSTIPAGNSSGWGSIAWDTSGLAGYHDIFVVADPNHTVAELTDSNNTAFRSITVAGYAVDLACPDNTSTVQAGASHIYQINVTNTGTLTDTITLTIDNPTDWDANFNDNPPAKAGNYDVIASAPQPEGRPVNGYHTFAEIEAELQNIAAAHPDICQLLDIGDTWESRDLWVMKVSDNVTANETGEPEVFVMGGIHAREWIADEVPLYYLNWLVDNYGTDAEATWLVDNRQIYIAPCVNPDGLEYSQTVGDWRKNRRDNGDGTFGVDLNRNWAGACNGDPNGDWGGAGTTSLTSDETYCGPAPFSEPETQALRDFILAHDFQITLAYHSYGEEIYWPWGYDTAVHTPTDTYQSAMASDFAAINGYTPMQSAASYFTTGDTDDWIYGYNWYNLSKEVYPFTIELGTSFQPPQSEITPICDANLGVNRLATRYADNLHMDSPVIAETPLDDTTDTTGPYTVWANITSPVGLSSATLYWRTTGAWNQVAMSNVAGDTWRGDIPGQGDGTWVRYYVEAVDVNSHRSTDPIYAPYDDNRFFVGNDVVEYTVTLASLEWRIVNLTVTAPPTALPNEMARISVIGTSNNDPAKSDSVETVTTVAPGILLVNDGNAAIGNYQTALDNGGYYYDVGTPTTDLSDYRIVIWATDSSTTLSTAEKTALANFMDGGGSVYINGEDIGYDIASDDDTGIGSLGPAPNNFYGHYLHASYLSDSGGSSPMSGVPGDPITDGMTGYTISGSWPSEIAPADASASTIFTYDGSGNAAGIKADDGTYKLVYIACEYFEGSDPQANKDLLMDRILNWLNPDAEPVVSITNPTGAEQVYSGILDITWIASDDLPLPDNCVDIYYMDDGENWQVLATGLNNTGTYSWDTTAYGDSFAYKLRVVVTDTIGQTGSDETQEFFSVDNVPDDLWFFQSESVNLAPSLDMDMKPCEDMPAETIINVTGTGEFLVESFASEFVATGDTELAGTWNFAVNAKVDSVDADGNLYASVYADDGITARHLFDTGYCADTVGSYLTYNEFSWSHTVPAGTTVHAGEHVRVDIMLHATSGTASSTHYNLATGDIPVTGTVTGDYTNTQASDDTRETISEVSGGAGTVSIIAEDFENGGALPAGWDNADYDAGGGNAAEAQWHTTTSTEYAVAGAGDYAMVSDSDNTGSGADMWAWLKSPVFDASGYDSVTLEFQHEYNWYNEAEPEGIYVYVAPDGSVDSSDTQVYHTVGADISGLMSLDITAACAGSSTVQIGWFYDANYDWWWAIDDVYVNGSINTSLLEHRWTVDVPASEAPYQFYLEARRNAGADGDDFTFSYSTDNVSFTDMVTVNSATDNTYTYSLPAGLSGTVYIKVVDTDRTSGNLDISSVEIDHMYISSVGGAPRLFMAYDYYLYPSNVEPCLSGGLPTYDIPLLGSPGWNFISFPLAASGSPADVLSDLAGDGTAAWDMVRWYDPQDPADPWKTYNPAKPPGLNDLASIDNTMGLWVHVTDPGTDGMLTVQGTQPVSTNINLYTGWNLVSYPSATPALASATLPAQADMVAVYDDAQPYLIRDVTDLGTVTMSAGNAYWVHVTSDTVWTVNW